MFGGLKIISRFGLAGFRGLFFVCLFSFVSMVSGGLVAVGEVEPLDIDLWWVDVDVYVGNSGYGSLSVDEGFHEIATLFIGNLPEAEGDVLVSGVETQLCLEEALYIGNEGKGALSIVDEGVVRVAGDTYLNYDSEFDCSLHLDGGRLETWNLYCSLDDISGTGMISALGLFADGDLEHGFGPGSIEGFYVRANPTQDIFIYYHGMEPLGIGYRGAGSLACYGGSSLHSLEGYVGYLAGSRGEVVVKEEYTYWSIDEVFYVGYYGYGFVDIQQDSEISCGVSYVGYGADAEGEIMVSGGRFDVDGELCVGYEGIGTLDMQDGRVNCDSLTVGLEGIGSLDMQDGWVNCSSLMIGFEHGSVGSVNVYRGTLGCDGDFYVGGRGFASVDVEGSVWAENMYISCDETAIGSVSTFLGGELDCSGRLFVGLYGEGLLDIMNYSSVDCNSLAIGGYDGSNGYVVVDGDVASLDVREEIRFGVYGGYGQLDVLNGARLYSSSFIISDEIGLPVRLDVGGRGSVNVDGGNVDWGFFDVAGDVIVDGDVECVWDVRNDGQIRIGGDVNISRGGKFDLTVGERGTLFIDGAVNIDEFSRRDTRITICKEGRIAIKGECTDLESFLDRLGGVGVLLYFDDYGMTSVPLDNATSLHLYYSSSSHSDYYGYTVLYVGYPCAIFKAGDLNWDCQCNLLDLAILAESWGVDGADDTSIGRPGGDISGDNKVGVEDLILLAEDWLG